MSPVIYRLCMIDNTPLSLQLGREINFQDFMTCLNEQNIYIIRRRYVSKFWGEAELTGIILPGGRFQVDLRRSHLLSNRALSRYLVFSCIYFIKLVGNQQWRLVTKSEGRAHTHFLTIQEMDYYCLFSPSMLNQKPHRILFNLLILLNICFV
jgi:hypothetical protein